jgi:hypothetical protein
VVFTLVPPTFHKRAMELYLSIGQPEVTVGTFWDIYHNLLERLREPRDKHLTQALNTFQANLDNDAQDMALLPKMEPFRLGRPLNLGGRSTYLGRLEESSEALPLVQSLHYLRIVMIAAMRAAQICVFYKQFCVMLLLMPWVHFFLFSLFLCPTPISYLTVYTLSYPGQVLIHIFYKSPVLVDNLPLFL